MSIVCGAIGAAAMAPLRAQTTLPDPALPTAIEEALIEHACSGLHPVGTVETDAYLECRRNQLASLRGEFGRDLRRLSTAERAKIDAACSSLRASRGQDAYVACLSGQLVSLRGRGGRTAPNPADAAAPTAVAPSAAGSAAAPPPTQPSSRSSTAWIVVAVAALMAAVAGVLIVRLRRRRAFGTCHSCGAKLLERGDLCHACRHEAAEALRRATAERTDQERAAADEAQRKQAARAQEEQQRVRDEETRRQQLEAAEQARAREQEEEVRRRREEDERQQQQQTDAAASPGEFDPYAALGVARTAGAPEIEAAYQEARAKYDLELVAGLSTELQEHFKRKGEAAQRAYEMLTGR